MKIIIALCLFALCLASVAAAKPTTSVAHKPPVTGTRGTHPAKVGGPAKPGAHIGGPAPRG
jgi:hypothetical protein